jgi:hypothetical protein
MPNCLVSKFQSDKMSPIPATTILMNSYRGEGAGNCIVDLFHLERTLQQHLAI